MSAMNISIEYCGTCNYRPIAAGLAIAIALKISVKPVLVHSNDIGAFEIIVDDEIIFSKKLTGRFPEHDEIINILISKRGGA